MSFLKTAKMRSQPVRQDRPFSPVCQQAKMKQEKGLSLVSKVTNRTFLHKPFP
jgi:hypothetical protein